MANALDPHVLARIAPLELRARQAAEGFISGLHRSPHRGFSLEFAQYRGYVAGDDPRRLDWRVYARNERHVVREYETETNLALCLALDVSGSMAYRSPDAHAGLAKLDWARTAAATIAALALGQRDAVAAASLGGGADGFVRRSTMPAQLPRICGFLDGLAGRGEGGIGSGLARLAGLLPRRSLVVLLSDLLDEPAAIRRGLQLLRQAQREVVVLHLLDPRELELPFTGEVAFMPLEDGAPLRCRPRELRADYLAELADHLASVRRGCIADRCEYQRLTTATPIDRALAAWLGARRRQAGRGGWR